MRRAPLALACLVLAGAASGCGNEGPIDVPDDATAPPASSFVKPLGAAVRLDLADSDETYLTAFVETFSSLTPENEMKWVFVEPEQDEFDFGPGDRLVELAEETGKRVRGHTLVWDEQLPDWLTEGDWSRAELAEILRNHVRTVVEHYRGRVAEWDVVNEPFEDDGRFTRNLWYRVLGSSYVDIAFRAAQAADPNALLFVNELGAEAGGPKQDALIKLVANLRRRGVPIHGVGFQGHISIDAALTKKQWLDLFGRAAQAGLGMAITELDVVIPREDAPPDALERQARIYGDAAEACIEATNCTGLTVWGVTDEYSWRGASRRPLLFDADGEPKPALEAVNSVFRR